MYIVDLINKKRNNLVFTKEEIDYIINEYTNDNIKDYQVFIKQVFSEAQRDSK